MVNIDRILLLFIILVAATFIGCKQQKQVVVLTTNESLNTEAREIRNFSNNWVKALERLSYSYSTSPDEKIIALVFKRDDKWFYKEYVVKIGETLTLEPGEGQLAYVTLPANKTIAYSWLMIENENSDEPEKVSYKEWIHIPFDNKKEVEGENYDRQVFDLTAGENRLPLKFLYNHINNDRNDAFECVIQSR